MDATAAILIGVAVVLAYIAAITFALAQIIREQELSDMEKLVWVIALVGTPFMGAVVWFVAGPHPFGFRLDRNAMPLNGHRGL